MAVKPTPNNSLYKGLVFDGVDSRDYGIYITGEAVFNSPERDVEMIEIPGRNGAYALDKGRFSNIEVSYPAGIFGDTEADFRQGIRAFRNALASRKGYKRLEDDYNPDEYRMAVYKSGLEVTPTALKAGEFTITFDCQPQRWLKSGETAVSVANGGTITNPTLFDASPLLEVYGYGEIEIGTGSIVVADDVLVGDVVLSNGASINVEKRVYNEVISYNPGYFEAGDIITLAPTTISARFFVTADIIDVQIYKSGYDVEVSTTSGHRNVSVLISWPEETFTAGTSKDISSTVTVSVSTSGGSVNVEFPATITYDAANRQITRNVQPMTPTGGTIARQLEILTAGTITAHSTAPAYTEPLYFDLSIGEAYAIEGGTPVSINGAVSFGVDLPVLPPGANTITYDNTIDDLKIIPRWWEV